MIAMAETYKKRSTFVANCTDLAIEDIYLSGQQGCDTEGNTVECMWIGTFAVAVYNDWFTDDTIEYLWEVWQGEGYEGVSVAFLDGIDDQKVAQVGVLNSVDTLFNLKCTITTTGGGYGNDALTIEVETRQATDMVEDA